MVRVHAYPQVEPGWMAEMRARGRLTDAQINQLAIELKLDLQCGSAWETLEALSKWEILS